MSTDRWTLLSDWHNAWLSADPAERRRLRDQLAARSPEMMAEADSLVAANDSIAGFLETPAFVLTAAHLAHDAVGLAAGTAIGPYRITSLIARGGMGVVYAAEDTRLGRRVALKTLAPLVGPNELGIDRFLREARITASLDHPNIVKVYDVGTHDGQPFMVVELLEGETLRQKLDRGPMPEAEVRRIGAEIAKGLVAANAAGLVHRDLKPENVFLTRAGVTKILDFGIAKLAPEAARRRAGASTLTGILLGTAGYLAPEQIQGEADGRADLFALGSILFEMSTGQRAFACENTVDTLHAILHEPAPDLLKEGRNVSASLNAIVSRLLQKAPADRFQTAADLVWALEQSADWPENRASLPQSRPPAPELARRRSWRWIAAPIAASALLIGGWWIGRGSIGAPDRDLARFSWALPSDTGLWSAPAVSPDGSRIAWAGVSPTAGAQLFLRDLSAGEATPLAGTSGARQPFWSPDGQWIGFFARGKLSKIASGGGPVVVLADAPDGKGGAWSSAGVIVFQPNYRDTPLMRVSDQGGAVEPATALDIAQDDVGHKWPAFLPDGQHFLYFGASVRDDRRGVYVGSLDEPRGQPTAPIFLSDSGAVFVPMAGLARGLVLSAAGGRIEVRSFDAARRVVVGDARSIEVNATSATPHHAALLSASSDVLAYGSGLIPWGFRFARIDRDGSNLRLEPDNQLGGFPRLSPDGKFLARCRVDPVRLNPDIWVDDLERGTTLRLTTSAEHDVMPAWSPDASEVVYRAGTRDKPMIGFAAADGSGVKRALPCPKSPCEPNDWSPDGTFLILTVGGSDIWKLPLEAGATPQPLLAESFTERDARISPDGRWLAYVSDETGQPEVSVRSLTGSARRFVVSSGGGDQPVWRHDGAELFFAGPEGRLFAVSVRPGPPFDMLRAPRAGRGANAGLSFGAAAKLNVPPLGERHWGTIYDVSLDGRRVYFPHTTGRVPPREFGVVMGWRALIK